MKSEMGRMMCAITCLLLPYDFSLPQTRAYAFSTRVGLEPSAGSRGLGASESIHSLTSAVPVPSSKRKVMLVVCWEMLRI